MTELLLKRARDVAPDVDPAETSLLIVAHGTNLNENSAVAIRRLWLESLETTTTNRLPRSKAGSGTSS